MNRSHRWFGKSGVLVALLFFCPLTAHVVAGDLELEFWRGCAAKVVPGMKREEVERFLPHLLKEPRPFALVGHFQLPNGISIGYTEPEPARLQLPQENPLHPTGFRLVQSYFGDIGFMSGPNEYSMYHVTPDIRVNVHFKATYDANWRHTPGPDDPVLSPVTVQRVSAVER